MMTLDDLWDGTGEWLKGSGPDSDIVMSSRIRLARNIDKYPFPHWADAGQLEGVIGDFKSAYCSIDHFKGALFLRMGELDSIEKQMLIERHLVSREHAFRPEHKAVLISDREIISIMVNEEDHLRIQVLQSGLNLRDTWKLADRIDEELGQRLDFAYSPEAGYLTCCPTNIGTGLRASCMVHLPALVMTKQSGRIIQAIGKLGMTARGLFGEGTESYGNFFQISNQVTLGHPEEDMVDNLGRMIKQIIDQENAARDAVFANQRLLLEDRMTRSLEELKNAKLISTEEALNLLSTIRLGADLGIIKGVDRDMLNGLFIQIQPAHLQKKEGKQLSAEERDAVRADFISQKFNLKD
ncbi:MAG: protein arginine kinase [Candidatus Omnitrophota bacterium]